MAGVDKRVDIFPKRICTKVNVIAQLWFDIANNKAAVQLVSHNSVGIPAKLTMNKVKGIIFILIV